MRKFYRVVYGLLVFPWAGAASAQDTAINDMICDITDEQTLYWPAMSQAVTLRTRITFEGEGYPVGHLTLILEDETQIDLGEGFKYTHDSPNVDQSDCQISLEIAKADTLDSLSSTTRFKTLKSLWAYSAMGQDCIDGANLSESGPSEDCQLAASIHQSFQESLMETPMENKQFKRLFDGGAPLITVRRSTYYSETLVYDAQANTLHTVLTQGC